MPEDEALLRQMAVDIAIIRTKLEENEKLNLAARMTGLEQKVNEILVNKSTAAWLLNNGKSTIAWIITTGIAVYAAWK